MKVSVICIALCFAVGGSAIKPTGMRVLGGPRDDPIGTSPPNFPGGQIANDAPPGPFFQDFRPPFPTDAWWSGFTVGNQDATVAGPFPFQVATTANGLVLGLSDHRDFDGTSIHVNTQQDWTVGIADLPADNSHRKATSWDTQTVCLQYFNNGGSTMDTCLVPGSPYLSFKFNNAAVILTSNKDAITSFQWVTPGTKAKVTHGGGTYIIYVTSGNLELNQDGNRLVSPPGFSGTIRLAKLKDGAQESVLDQHSTAIPSGLDMRYNVAGDVATQTWTWSVSEGNAGDLLILSWPHHRRALQNPNYVGVEYLTLKGMMKGIRGDKWEMRHELPTITWFSPNAPHPSCLNELKKTLEVEVNNLEVMIPGDFYFWGGAFGRASRLALIAEHIGENGLVNRVVDILKQSIDYWFQSGRTPSAAFETGWGGFINKEGWNNTWVDFGNAYYNDHHFHYGYLLQGAGTIGKYDQGWLNEHMDFMIHVARNVGNPSPNDPHYAVTRHMDFFAGHSWASGIANGAGPRDQESSGEAINGYYGLLLFATAANNQALIDWSRLVLAMELAGAREYWHLYPRSNDPEQPYPEQAFRDLTTVGNVMDTQAGAWLFWGAERIQIAAIQILPLTPIGYYTYDREWMEGVLDYCKQELDDPKFGDDFKSVIYAAYAKVDPVRAYEFSTQLFSWGSGNSASNQLYFVSTQQSGGDICSAANQTPEGTFTVQDAATGQFVTVAGDGHLAATTGSDAEGERFLLAFTPGGATIKASSNNKFVTAGPDGNSALSASRDVAQSYEIFRWKANGDGTYVLTAMVNRMFVTTQGGSGDMINNAGNEGQASRYRLTQV
ncbi:Endo-1,3(4)-beta-glucanase 1 [Orchesella cincta]|uniref:glucan endo-1,3-beta-D-glucosidase n=1 Tax=Orchesella cincta TaxID=48709 RepID=A0A1D2M2W6_ORCCI|nr:Endo-1,3(4)-beta-glucanase 1 [Orchesella cincta]